MIPSIYGTFSSPIPNLLCMKDEMCYLASYQHQCTNQCLPYIQREQMLKNTCQEEAKTMKLWHVIIDLSIKSILKIQLSKNILHSYKVYI